MHAFHPIPPPPNSPSLQNSHWPIVPGFFPLILALGPTQPLQNPPILPETEVLLGQQRCRTHTHQRRTHGRTDPRLSVFADHFTGQSPYPSLQGHCGSALSWERPFIHRENPSFSGFSLSAVPSLLDDGWRKGRPHTDTELEVIFIIWRGIGTSKLHIGAGGRQMAALQLKCFGV